MSFEISYHIVDFKVGEANEIKILELGNAFYGSNLSERSKVFNNIEAMLKHAARYGSIEIKNPKFRSFRHYQGNAALNSESPSYLQEIQSPPSPKITVVDDGVLMFSAGMEYIQELHDAFSDGGSTTQMVFDGTIDTFYLCDRNKRIFNKLLELNKLQQVQPETWYYQLDSAKAFEPPADIPFFIIKPMDESLGKGVMLVSNEDLLALLEAIKTGAHFPKNVGDIDFYSRSQNKKVLIQRFYPGKELAHQGQLYRPTARAVFAVVKKEDSISVDIIDIFWKLPKSPIQSNIPTASESVSYVGKSSDFRSQISLEEFDYQQIKRALQEMLTTVSTGIYNFDIKSYLFKLYETKQLDEINYYLENYGHVRARGLDEEFIALIHTVNTEKAKAFLVEQARYFALPWHLEYKNICLKTWLDENLEQLEPKLLADLQKCFKDAKESISGAGGLPDKELIVESYNEYLCEIHGLLEDKKKMQEPVHFKQNLTQTFFGVQPKKPGEEQVTTSLELAS